MNNKDPRRENNLCGYFSEKFLLKLGFLVGWVGFGHAEPMDERSHAIGSKWIQVCRAEVKPPDIKEKLGGR